MGASAPERSAIANFRISLTNEKKIRHRQFNATTSALQTVCRLKLQRIEHRSPDRLYE